MYYQFLEYFCLVREAKISGTLQERCTEYGIDTTGIYLTAEHGFLQYQIVKMVWNYSFGGESTQSCWQQCGSWLIRTHRSHGLQCIVFDPVQREASEAAFAGGYCANKITHLGGLTTSQGLHWKHFARADFNHEAVGVVEKNLVNFNAAFIDRVFDVFDAMLTQCLLNRYY